MPQLALLARARELTRQKLDHDRDSIGKPVPAIDDCLFALVKLLLDRVAGQSLHTSALTAAVLPTAAMTDPPFK